MSRQTSVDAYQAVKDSGWIGNRQKEIYDFMYSNGPLSSGECYWLMNKGNTRSPLTQSRARFTELRKMGLFQELGRKKCSVTNRSVIKWDVTNGLPTKCKKKLTKDEQIRRLKSAYLLLVQHASNDLKNQARRILGRNL